MNIFLYLKRWSSNKLLHLLHTQSFEITYKHHYHLPLYIIIMSIFCFPTSQNISYLIQILPLWSIFIFIIRLSAKGTNASWNTLANFRFSNLYSFWYYLHIRLTHYRTRGGEWRGLYSGDLVYLFVVGHPLRHQWLAHNVARKLISSKVDSILPDDQSMSVLNLQSSGGTFIVV